MRPSESSVWVDGTLYARDSLPPELAVRFGTSLGLSPACYTRENALLEQHVAVLERAAAALGYSGFHPEAAAESIAAVDAPAALVALVPTPLDHKAAAPGPDWILVAEPFAAPDRAEPLRLGPSPSRRNHRSPTSSTLLLGDAELHAGTRSARAAGHDDVVWLNLDDVVSCIAAGTVVAEIEGSVVTPPLADGVPSTAWRTAVLDARAAVERRIDLDDLLAARAVACVWPWGSVQAVAAVDDTTYADGSLAVRLDAVLAAATRGS